MQCYLVGGAVRDKLLGYPHHERDWVVVGATPAAMVAAGYKPVGRDFPVFLHPQTREEYALARIERKSGHGYHGFTFYSSPDVTLEQDLARRDLTINAIAEDEHGHLIDPYGGQRDLQQRVLRHVAPAFAEDPLRVLRVARFAARYHHLGFHIADETLELMRAIVDAGEIEHLVAERIWKETERALSEASPAVYFETLRHCGALARLCPELDVASFDNLTQAAQQSNDGVVRFAALCAPLDRDAAIVFCTRIKAPNDCRELALLAIAQMAAIANCNDGQQALALFDSADAWRRPERFAQLLAVARALQIPTTKTHRLEQLRPLAAAIDTQTLIAQGFSGKALGEQLRHERLRAIEMHWSQLSE
jgi:tRNA nucleotidyltransferase (CCA-adding enzyme)